MSLNEKTISQGEDFPEHCLQMRSSNCENNWSANKTGNLLRKTKILKRPPTYDRVYISNTVTRSETAEKIGRKKKLGSLRIRDSEIKSSDNFGTPYNDVGYIDPQKDPQ